MSFMHLTCEPRHFGYRQERGLERAFHISLTVETWIKLLNYPSLEHLPLL